MSDIDSLPGRAKKGEQAVNELTRAFQDLSEKGRINAQTFETLAIQMSRVGPAGLAAGGAVVLLAEGVKKLHEESERQAKADLASVLANIATEAKTTGDAWDAYYAAIIRGAGEADAALEKNLSEALSAWATIKATTDQRIEKINEETAAREKQRQEILSANEPENQVYQERLKQIDAIIQQNKKDVDAIRVSLGEEAKARRIVIEPIEDEIDALHRLHQEQTADLAIMAQTVSLVAAAFNDLGGSRAQAPDVSGYMSVMKDIATVTNESTAATLSWAEATKQSQEEAASMIAASLGQVGVPLFNAYTQAIYDAAHAQSFAADEIGKSLGKAFRESVKVIGQDAAVHALYETAMGLASLWVNPPAAATHFAAAETFGLVAATAGVATAALGGKGFAGGASGGGGGGGGGGGSGYTVNQTVTIIGTLDYNDAANLHQQLAAAAAKGDLA
jgi:hypothetical protein